MRRNLVRSALLGSLLAAAMPMAAYATDAPDDRVRAAATGTLEICTSGSPDFGIGQFSVEAYSEDINYLTPVLDGNVPANTCWTQVTEEDTYHITPGKYLSAQCLKTANGHIVQNPQPGNNTGLEYSNDRCEAKVHHWHVSHNGGASSTLEVPELVVTVIPGQTTTVDAHVVDVRYPECTRPSDPGTSPQRRCEPTPGPTTS